MQENRPERIADFMGHPRCQTAEQGEVLGALSFTLQALTLSHFVAQSSGAFLHAPFEFVMSLLERLFGLLTRGNIRQRKDATSNLAPGVQQGAEAQEELNALAIAPYQGGLETLLYLAVQGTA